MASAERKDTQRMSRDEARARAKALVSQMTLEEKTAQLRFNAPAIERLGVPAYNWWNEALHGVARAGTATVFPQAIALAAIFDEEFHGEVASVIAEEARAKYNAQSAHGDRDIYKGLTLWSPNINIFRDPRWGRGQETYGEDPYLTSRLGVRFIRGLQGEGKYLKTAACAKHFAVHSGPESERHGFDAQISPKDLRETYLPAFEAAVKEGEVESVMGAYNRVNGEPACASPALQDILRGEWGFEGHFVSDCGAINDIHLHHHVTSSPAESAALAIGAGCDVNCGTAYVSLTLALEKGMVTEEQITRACERLFTTRYLLGMFADDCEYDAIPYTACDTKEGDALALRAAEKAMVLLRNDGVLPLSQRVRTLAVVGPNADSVTALEGNYNGTSSRYVTLLAGLRAACEARGIRVLYSEGCHLFKEHVSGLGGKDDRIAEAVSCAENADVVIACVGLDGSLEGEEGDAYNAAAAGDKLDLRVPQSQRTLLAALEATGKPMVTVLCGGSALNVPEGNAQLMAWYPGQAGGTALARILFGEVSPSGKLPVTFYEDTDDLPAFSDYAMAGRTYRYYAGKPLYPFGFGLSYTRFTAGDARVDAAARAAEATVTNAGDRDGETVVQVYVRAKDSADAEPNAHLAGFARVALRAGESKRVRVTLGENAFTVVTDAGERVTPGGRYDVYVGLSQPDERSCELLGARPEHLEIALPRG